MPKFPAIKAKELIRILNKLGFFKFHQVGSHAQFKHLDGRRIIVSIHPGKEIGRKTSYKERWEKFTIVRRKDKQSDTISASESAEITKVVRFIELVVGEYERI